MIGLESVLAGKAFADLPASPLQLAIARAADGRPLAGVLEPEALRAHFGVDELEPVMPELVVLVCGVRAGKSFLASCAAIKGALTADLEALKPHEVPRFAIVAPTVDNARATFRILVGIVRGSKVLRAMVVPRKKGSEDADATLDTLELRRPDGRRVEIVVVAAHRGAVTMRSRWLVGFVLDEVALFGAEATGAAVNAEELLRAGETRLVPRAQGWLISSPFGPSGLLYELWREHFGKPGEVLVVHAPTRAMNPSFPEKKVDAVRRRDADTAAREYDAAWLDATTALLDGRQLDAATRKAPAQRPPVAGVRYVAAGDAATRGNAWTLVVGHAERAAPVVVDGVRLEQPLRVVVDGAWQWIGSKSAPLSPATVLEEQAAILRPYGTRTIFQDHVMLDALRDLARQHKLYLEEQRGEQLETYMQLRTAVASSALELPPDAFVRQDLAGIRRKVTSSGTRIELPTTANGRHSDFAPAIALLVRRALLEGPGNAAPAKVSAHRDQGGWVGGFEHGAGNALAPEVGPDGAVRMVRRRANDRDTGGF